MTEPLSKKDRAAHRSEPNAIRLHPLDDCAVVLRTIEAGEIVTCGEEVVGVAREKIQAGHKVATRDIAAGSPIVKYGSPIGKCSSAITLGQHIHDHNCCSSHEIDPSRFCCVQPVALEPRRDRFEGYVRSSGRVGTRNYLAIISTVNCSASVARWAAETIHADEMSSYPNVDGIIALRHQGGCAMALHGSKHQMLARVLRGMASHPNIGGIVLVGLGCEQVLFADVVDEKPLVQLGQGDVGRKSSQAIPALTIQAAGGTRPAVARAAGALREMLPIVNQSTRQTVSAEHLILATECGGSDSYSGITANPAIGRASDLLIASGGTSIVSEVTELYGAEHLLTERARTPEVAQKLLDRIEWWKWYTGLYGQTIDNNPSIGNKAGGLTTIEEKSLGAAAKGGSTTLNAVYEYAEPVTAKGLVVMDSPGFDPASVTGMVAGGANLVCFSTGRGCCFGFKPVPSFKVASNSLLARSMPEDMDFDAGVILDGASVEDVGESLYHRLLAMASGEKTKSELLGYGDDEFIPWTIGPTL